MKNLIISISTILIILTFFAFTLNEEKPFGALGDVKYSVLPPDKFKELNGTGWILLDGATINGSDLQTSGLANEIPDARGMFIRGLNLTRNDDRADPFVQENKRQRLVGDYQGDEFKSHNHPLTFSPQTGNIINSGINFYNENVGRSDRITTTSVGGNETRPKNIALYIYIKINN